MAFRRGARAHYQPCAVNNNQTATTEEGEAADEGMGNEREQAGGVRGESPWEL